MKQDEYDTQALEFLKDTDTTFKAEFSQHGLYFNGDKDKRDIYNITLTRGERSYTFRYGQSINDSGYKAYGKRVLFKKDGTPARELLHAKAAFKEIYGHYPQKGDITKPETPTEYYVLAVLTKYDPGSFEDFCSEYGYNTDSRSAEKVYNAVVKEYAMVCALWNEDELNALREIQ